MKLSVIIPALNEAHRVDDAIQQAWRLNPLEVIVVDGQSSDATADVCGSHECTLIECEPGRGPQLNAGAANASGDVLLFLHVDCHLPPEATDQIADALADTRVQAGGFRQRIDSEARIYRWIERGNAWRLRHRGVAFGDQGIFMRRAFFDQLGGFPETPIMEDLILMKRARRQTIPVLLPGPLHVSARRWQQRGVVRQTLRNWLLQIAYTLGVPTSRLAGYYPPDESGQTAGCKGDPDSEDHR